MWTKLADKRSDRIRASRILWFTVLRSSRYLDESLVENSLRAQGSGSSLGFLIFMISIVHYEVIENTMRTDVRYEEICFSDSLDIRSYVQFVDKPFDKFFSPVGNRL